MLLTKHRSLVPETYLRTSCQLTKLQVHFLCLLESFLLIQHRVMLVRAPKVRRRLLMQTNIVVGIESTPLCIIHLVASLLFLLHLLLVRLQEVEVLI